MKKIDFDKVENKLRLLHNTMPYNYGYEYMKGIIVNPKMISDWIYQAHCHNEQCDWVLMMRTANIMYNDIVALYGKKS